MKLNGHELDGLDGVERAFNYLRKQYNTGDMHRTKDSLGREVIFIWSRGNRLQHLEHLIEADGVEVSDVVAYDDGDGPRLQVEVTEANDE